MGGFVSRPANLCRGSSMSMQGNLSCAIIVQSKPHGSFHGGSIFNRPRNVFVRTDIRSLRIALNFEHQLAVLRTATYAGDALARPRRHHPSFLSADCLTKKAENEVIRFRPPGCVPACFARVYRCATNDKPSYVLSKPSCGTKRRSEAGAPSDVIVPSPLRAGVRKM